MNFYKIKRILLSILGLFFLGVGIIGYIIPGLPGTIFLIIAATLFLRSSDRLYKVVTENKFFGPTTKRFLDTGSMTLRAKIMSCSSIWVFTIASILFAPYGTFFITLILITALLGTIYIVSRPTDRTGT